MGWNNHVGIFDLLGTVLQTGTLYQIDDDWLFAALFTLPSKCFQNVEENPAGCQYQSPWRPGHSTLVYEIIHCGHYGKNQQFQFWDVLSSLRSVDLVSFFAGLSQIGNQSLTRSNQPNGDLRNIHQHRASWCAMPFEDSLEAALLALFASAWILSGWLWGF